MDDAIDPATDPATGPATDLATRARLHAALGDPHRLAIIDELTASDRSPGELATRLDLAPNLLAHHLDALARCGIVERTTSAGDRRRRYVRLIPDRLLGIGVRAPSVTGAVLFVCTHNSARSQLAAALWDELVGAPAASAGTHPATSVHPGAVAAATRHGLVLRGVRPTAISSTIDADLVVTVCDQAHEELSPGPDWWHWSLPDPVAAGKPSAFDATVDALTRRIRSLHPQEHT